MYQSLCVPNTGMLTKRQKEIIFLMVFAAALLFLLCIPAFATGTGDTGTTITNEVKKGAKEIYDIFKGILAPIAVVMIVWSVIKALFFGDKGMETAKRSMLIILGCVILVYLAPLMVTTVAEWFSDIGTRGVF